MALYTRSSFASLITIAGLLAIWWVASALAAVDAQRILRNARTLDLYLYLDLLFLQVTLGIFMCCVVQCLAAIFSTKGQSSLYYKGIGVDGSLYNVHAPSKPTAVGAAVMHTIGALMTNASFLYLGSTSTQIWKLMEPLTTVFLKCYLLHQTTTPLSLLGILVTISGVGIFSNVNIHALSASPIIIANLAYPTRNVLIKKLRDTPSLATSLDRYLHMQILAFPLAFMLLFCKSILRMLPLLQPSQQETRTLMNAFPIFTAFPQLLRNAFLFNTYQLASMIILQKLDPVSHSLGNTGKRIASIIVSMMLLREALSAKQSVGLAFAMIGFVMYIAGKSMPMIKRDGELGGKRTKKIPLALKLMAGGVILTMALISLMVVSRTAVNDKNKSAANIVANILEGSRAKTLDDRNLVSKPNPSKLSKEIEQHSSDNETPLVKLAYFNHYQGYKSTPLIDWDDARKRVPAAGNVGNYLWQYGGQAIVDMEKADVCSTANSTVCTEERRRKSDVLYIPTANLIHEYRGEESAKSELKGIGWILRRARWEKKPFIFVGIGSQAEFDSNPAKRDLIPNFVPRTRPSDFHLSPSTKELLGHVVNRSCPILVRGKFTEKILHNHGFTNAVAAGCPSLMLNKNKKMGVTLQRRYEGVASQTNDTSLKLALNMPPRFLPRLIKFYHTMLQRYPNSVIYLQDERGLKVLEKAEKVLNVTKVPMKRIRFHTDVQQWQDTICKYDAVLGSRIHGSMIAFQCNVPVFIIATDHRVKELADVMKLPHTTVYDPRVNKDTFDFATVLQDEKFNGSSFDKNRCQLAKIYVDKLSPFRIPVASHVRAIAESCSR